MDYVRTKNINPETGVLEQEKVWGNLGDWLGPEDNKNDKTLMWEAYFLYDLDIMKKVAQILGKKILDEAQNTTTQQIKMFLTRMGMNTKMIVTGDMTQIDLPSSQTSGLIQALKILKGVKGISFIELNKKDIVRHKLVTRIVEAYEKFEEKQKTFHSCHSERSEKSENIKRIY